jgi:hypothetical protein
MHAGQPNPSVNLWAPCQRPALHSKRGCEALSEREYVVEATSRGGGDQPGEAPAAAGLQVPGTTSPPLPMEMDRFQWNRCRGMFTATSVCQSRLTL